MILNLGCGGDVRLHTKIEGPEIINYDLDPKASWMDIRGDAHCLPFFDKTFEHSLVAHILEHCQNPLLVLREVARVTEKQVVVKVPNAEHYKFFNEDSGHIFSWNAPTFRNILSQVFPVVDVRPSWVLRAKDYPRKLVSMLLILANKKETQLVGFCRNE